MIATVTLETLIAALTRTGLLLQSDSTLPSAVTIAAGEPIRGSWWGHPKGKIIFDLFEELLDHPDVVTAKLIGGKVTYVHRSFWPALTAVATSGESWQTVGLPLAAAEMLIQLRQTGPICADKLIRLEGLSTSKIVDELEKRLLVNSLQIHTEAGHHDRVLQTWEHWAAERHVVPDALASSKAKLEVAVEALGSGIRSRHTLPWRSVS